MDVTRRPNMAPRRVGQQVRCPDCPAQVGTVKGRHGHVIRAHPDPQLPRVSCAGSGKLVRA